MSAAKSIVCAVDRCFAIHFQKTCPAINRTALRRIKGNCRHSRAFRAFSLYFDSLVFPGEAVFNDRLETAIFCFFTLFAAFWRI